MSFNLYSWKLNNTENLLEFVKGKYRVHVQSNYDNFGLHITVYNKDVSWCSSKNFNTLTEALSWVEELCDGEGEFE